MICRECAKPMTDEEIYYYGSRCEMCEVEWFERIEAWRLGAQDDSLDKLYGGAPPAVH